MNNYLVKSSSLTRYLSEINRFPILSREEEHELAAHYKEHGDMEAAHKLVTANLRFVVKIALQYKNYGVKLRDLIQEGNMGLMVAVKKFDPKKGFRLISYAVWWIRAYIQKFILETFSLVKMGTTHLQRKLFSSLAKIRRKLTSLDGSEPSDELLAKSLEVNQKDLVSMRHRMSLKDSSLDAPLSDDRETTHLEMLPSVDSNQEELFAKREEDDRVSSLLKPFLSSLKENERCIVEKRLMSDEPATLEEIGEVYNITRERVRQIEENVKKKIKGYLTEKGFSYSV